jgi:hypothetical protein
LEGYGLDIKFAAHRRRVPHGIVNLSRSGMLQESVASSDRPPLGGPV